MQTTVWVYHKLIQENSYLLLFERQYDEQTTGWRFYSSMDVYQELIADSGFYLKARDQIDLCYWLEFGLDYFSVSLMPWMNFMNSSVIETFLKTKPGRV